MSDTDSELSQADKKALAQFEVARAIRHLDLDDWTKTFLANAIASLSRGLYGLAAINARIAATLPEERLLRFEPDADVTALTRERLESALAEIRQQPPVVALAID